MSSNIGKLQEARQLLDPILGEGRTLARCALGHAGADSALGGGLARGALHEIFASDPCSSGFAACVAKRVSGSRRVLWIIHDFSTLEHGDLSPTGLAEFGIDPAQVLLFRAANAADALRAGVDALSCSSLGAVILEIAGNPKVLDLVASRRLAFAAQQRGVTTLLLRQSAQIEPSAAQTRWQTRSTRAATKDDWEMPRFDAALVRNRQGETGRWVMEWSCDDGTLRKPADQTAHHGAVVRTPADGSAATVPVRIAG